MEEVALVVTTCGSEEEATRLARTLVEQRLAACVSYTPIRSTYWWQGAVEESREVLLFVKTPRALVKRVFEVIRSLHSYQLPELIALPVADGDPDYLRWIIEETRG